MRLCEGEKDADNDGVAAWDTVCVALGESVGVCVSLSEAVADCEGDSVGDPDELDVADALGVGELLGVRDTLDDWLCVWLLVTVALGVSVADAVTLAVCEALGAHDCWIADSPTPRYGDSDVHVTPELLDARLAKGVAVPLTGPPATAWRLKAGKPEIRRANAEALHALNTRDESGRTMKPGDAGRGTEKIVVRARALPMGLPVVVFAENTASWRVVAAVAGADRDTARMSCVSD